MPCRLLIELGIIALIATGCAGSPIIKTVSVPCPATPPPATCNVAYDTTQPKQLRTLQAFAYATLLEYERCKNEVLNRRDADKACAKIRGDK